MQRKDWREALRTLALVSQLGLTMISAVGVAFFIGHYLDRLVGLPFLFAGIFLLPGIGGGFYACYKMIMQAIETPKKDR